MHPEVLAVVRAVGNDLSEAKPQNNGELAREARSLIRMGCGDKYQRVQGCAGMIGF
jgi:hypothetical protein